MCGVAAIIGRAGDGSRDIQRMIDVLAHRGPDAEETWVTDGCALGSRRLAVIDLEGGSQPMTSADKRSTLVFNGEIYNYRDLRARLLAEGVRFRTESDTEVVLEGFRRHGEDFVRRLNGQFAFVVWDNERARAFAARDRLGEKPLFWACPSSDELVVASEVGGVLASGRVRPRLDYTAVRAYLALNYVPPSIGIFENILPLPPAHSLTWEGEHVELARYWQPTYSQDDVALDDAARHVRHLLEAAVERQMTSADVEVGCFLSGWSRL